MSEPTPPGSAPQEPSFQPPVAPPSQPPAAPPPPPGGGYSAGPPVGGNVAPVGYATNEEKTWALVSHFGGAAAAFVSGGFLGWVPALVAMLTKGNDSPTVRAHAVAALNFQALWTIVAVIGYVTFCLIIGFIILPVAILMSVIFGILAGVKANEGQLYTYPASPQIIK
ncbi:MAG TPA: DUF4870 domain-containing protein [Candidatus Limnocylindrales bacterium]|nr:DUF4870 domain-containing protein [Candidatus Limnocylindrales bacterium]